MRDLNEIITRNARSMIEAAQKAAAKEGRELTQHMIAGRMAEMMGMKQDSVRKQLERLLDPTEEPPRIWQAHYVQGLANALGKTPQELVSLDPDMEPVSEATVAQALYSALNHRLSSRDARRVVRRIQRQLDHRPIFDLIQALSDALLDADDRAEAYDVAHSLIRKSEAWGPKRRDLRGKKKRTTGPT